MTQNYIENVLGPSVLNKWVTLENQIQRISFISDGIITVDPRYRLFYFDTNTQMMHILNLTGELISTELNTPVPNGYVKISINNKYYLNKIAPSAVSYTLDYTETDFIHMSISFDKIVGMYRQTKIDMSDIFKEK